MSLSPLKVQTAFSSQSKSSFDSIDSQYLSFAPSLSPSNPKFLSLEKIINCLQNMPDVKKEEDHSNNNNNNNNNVNNPHDQQNQSNNHGDDGMIQTNPNLNEDNECFAITDEEYLDALKTLSDLTLQTIAIYKDPLFLRLLKSFGWTGTRYQIEKKLFDRTKFIQALSNIYLKFQYNDQFSIENLNNREETDGINYLEKIASFCPDIVADFLEKHPKILQSDQIIPPSHSFRGACMLVDISGFSKFSAAMCSKGVQGLDELRKVTNGLLGQFVKSVYEHDGDVIAFAGDALICVFPDNKINSCEILLRESTSLKSVHSTIRALHSAAALKSVKFTELSTHIGISYGEMTLAFLGGNRGQWVYVVNGTCLSQLHDCLEEAVAQMVVVTPECYEQLMKIQVPTRSTSFDESEVIFPTFGLTKLPNSENYQLDYVTQTDSFQEIILNTGGRKPLASHPSKKGSLNSLGSSGALLKYAASNLRDSKTLRCSSRSLSVRNVSVNNLFSFSSTLDDESSFYQQFVESLTLFVPVPVVTALNTEGNHQMGELRTVTTMFLCLNSYDSIQHADPSKLQPFFLLAQQALADSGAFLRQFLVDDKGCVLIAMWGVPSYTYANNCSRALYCATNIYRRIHEVDHTCSIGITTGTVFCGTIGAAERCDYVGIGSDVNLAARFMAKANGKIFVDESTYNSLSERNRKLLQAGIELSFKGIPYPVRPYLYASQEYPLLHDVDTKMQTKGKILKKRVMQLLDKQLDKIANISPSSISPADFRQLLLRAPTRKSKVAKFNNVLFTVLVGQPGTGKSTAAQYFRVGARERGIQTVHLVAQSQHRNTPYGIIRELFSELVGEHNFKLPVQQAAIIKSLIDEAYPENEFSDADRSYARSIVEMILGINTSALASRSSSLRHRALSASTSSRSPVLVRQSTIEPRLQELNTEIDEEFRFSAYQEFIISPARSSSLRRPVILPFRQEEEQESNNMVDSEVKNHAITTSGRAMKYDYPSAFSTKTVLITENENQIFFKLIAVFLRKAPIAMIIENAHFCDELTWNALFLLLHGANLDASVLITVRSNPLQRLRSSTKSGHSASFSGQRTSAATAATGAGANQPVNQAIINHEASKYSLPSISSQMDVEQMIFHYALDHITFESFRNLLGHNNCKIHEMKNLNQAEVGAFLTHKLKVSTISDELVKTVFNASSGNAYWCNMIADFIEEHGLHHLELTAAENQLGVETFDSLESRSRSNLGVESSDHDRRLDVKDSTTTPPSSKSTSANSKKDITHRGPTLSSINTLRTLILYRFELLSTDFQIILKYASVIGSEFTPRLLHSLLPIKLQEETQSTDDISLAPLSSVPAETKLSKRSMPRSSTSRGRRTLTEYLEQLEKHGFLSCISEHPTLIYIFQNELIQKTLYELIPPSDAATIHLQIADYIEIEFMDNLRPFYPTLASHYKFGSDSKNAFKYEIKSAALAISSGAFNDGYKLAEASLDVFSSAEELDIVIQVCDRAIADLKVILEGLDAITDSFSEPSITNSQNAFRNATSRNTSRNTSQIFQRLSQSVYSFISGGSINSTSMPTSLYPLQVRSFGSRQSSLSDLSVVEEPEHRGPVTEKSHTPFATASPVKKTVKINLEGNTQFSKSIEPGQSQQMTNMSAPNGMANASRQSLFSNDSYEASQSPKKAEMMIRQNQYNSFVTLKEKN